MNIVIFSNELEVVGGAEDYIIRKVITLIKNNYKVIVIAPAINDYYKKILIYNDIPFIINEKLGVSPKYLWKRDRRDLLNQIEKEISFCKWDCIESHQVYPMLWAELISVRLKIPNYIYLLSEAGNYPVYYKKLLNTKLNNKMLIGCNSMTIPIVAKKMGATIDDNNVFLNISVFPDEIKNQNYTIDIDKENEFVITTIARLDKYYVRYLIEEVTQVSRTESKPRLVLIIVGSGFYETEFKKLAQKHESENLRVIFTGTLKPLPKELFQITNLYIGMGTTVVLSAAMKCPTLTVDPFSNKSPGFFGEHTSNFAFTDDTSKLKNFSHYIMDVLKNENKLQSYSEIAFKCFQSQFENEAVLKKYKQIISENKNIFCEKNVYSISLVEQLQSVLYKLVGFSGYMKVKKYLIIKKRMLLNRDNWY